MCQVSACAPVALLELPVHSRWLEPLLASCLSTGASLKKELVCNLKSVWECGQLVHERDSQLAATALPGYTHDLTRCPQPTEQVSLKAPLSTDDYSLLAACPQCCLVPSPEGVCRKCTWNTSMSTSEVFSPFKWSAQRPKTCKKLLLLQYARRIQRACSGGANDKLLIQKKSLLCPNRKPSPK